MHATGLQLVQLALVPVVTDPDVWGSAVEILSNAGIRVASGMLALAGEDYSTLQSIRHSGGVRPEATWPKNLRLAEAVADAAGVAGIDLVTLHAGFLDERPDDPTRLAMLDRLRTLADVFAARDVDIAFETGQENAATLIDVLDELDRPAVGVNFDPANMILYGMGDPVAALKLLAPRVVQVHIKDAVGTERPGSWGREVPAGHGAIDWAAFFDAAVRIEPPVNFIIERESGIERRSDIVAARSLIETRLAATGCVS
jgi:sugar phosphate isomerase/epimerase